MKNKFYIYFFLVTMILITITRISFSQSTSEKLRCEKNLVFVGENIVCEARDCKRGNWFISNKLNEPIKNITLINIPPNRTIIGPTTEEGIVSINVICFDPSDYYGRDIQVIMGINLLCDRLCSMLKPCTCLAINCSRGVLTISNYNGTPLERDITRFVSSSPFEFIFNASGEGTVLARLDCFEPVILSRTNNIQIAKSCVGNVSLEIRPQIILDANKTYTNSLVLARPFGLSNCENRTIYIRRGSCSGLIECNTTQDIPCTFYTPTDPRTYEYCACIDKNSDNDFSDEGESVCSRINVIERPEEVKIENIECTSKMCRFNVTKNTVNESLNIIFYIFEEPRGRIYFSSLLNLDRFSVGDKTAFLSPPAEVANCSTGTQLTYLLHVYRSGKFNERIFRTKKNAFIC